MANPNSTWTRVRFIMAQWLDPYPDKGEAWCMDCELNGGRTLILNAAGHADHVMKHKDQSVDPDRGSTIAMRVNWGYIPPEDEG